MQHASRNWGRSITSSATMGKPFRPLAWAGAASADPAPWHPPWCGWQCQAQRGKWQRQETHRVCRRGRKEKRSASTRKRGAVNTGAYNKGPQPSLRNAMKAEEDFSSPGKAQGGGLCGSEAAEQQEHMSSSDAMGLGALAVRCQRQARRCSQRSMDFAAVHHTIAACNGPVSAKALSRQAPSLNALFEGPGLPKPACRAHRVAMQRQINPGQWL